MIATILKKETLYTLEKYFELEEKANYKSEFRNGKIVSRNIGMAGGTLNHSKIMTNITVNLVNTVADNYDVFNSELAIYIPKYNHAVYPDVCVVEGEPEMYQNRNRAILNPILIVEVASDSTDKYDRTNKFRKYKSLPSFKEYVLVDQDTPVVDVFFKDKLGWRMKTYVGLDEMVHLQSIGLELKMAAIYKKVKGLIDPQAILDLPPID